MRGCDSPYIRSARYVRRGFLVLEPLLDPWLDPEHHVVAERVASLTRQLRDARESLALSRFEKEKAALEARGENPYEVFKRREYEEEAAKTRAKAEKRIEEKRRAVIERIAISGCASDASHAKPCRATPSHAEPRQAMPSHAKPCRAMPSHAQAMPSRPVAHGCSHMGARSRVGG